MNIFEFVWQNKDNPKIVPKVLDVFLLSEIYSPLIVRQAYDRWSELPFYVKESIHPEMRKIIKNSPNFSNISLHHKINAYTISHAIKVLTAYSNCSIPLTTSKHIPTFKENILSMRGRWALKRLLHAICHNEITDDMAELAMKTSNKFLMDLKYYITWPGLEQFNSIPDALLFDGINIHGQQKYAFPVIQLSSGCQNNCSHCFADAKPHLSHMPYPIWRCFYDGLEKLYKYCEGEESFKEQGLEKFDRFYHDSDCAQYYDPIMGVDAGDISNFLTSNNRPFFFQTKGITDKISKRAIAKACSNDDIHMSFVDTPKENMPHNIKQFRDTVDLIKSVPGHYGVYVAHLFLKDGPSVADELFQDCLVVKEKIHAGGRANQFSSKLLDKEGANLIFPIVVRPDGQIVLPENRKGKYTQHYLGSFFKENRKEKEKE